MSNGSPQLPQNASLSGESRPVTDTPDRNADFDPPNVYARREEDVKPIEVGDGQWIIRFQMPGLRLIKTPFEMPVGQVYYISTPHLIRNLQVGWLDEDGVLKIGNVPASAFAEEKPLCYSMGSKANNAKVVFVTQLVPDGQYEIKIVKSVYKLAPGEYAPGVKCEKNYE